MSQPIPRYTLVERRGFTEICSASNGKYVRYESHEAVVQKMERDSEALRFACYLLLSVMETCEYELQDLFEQPGGIGEEVDMAKHLLSVNNVKLTPINECGEGLNP